MPPLFNQNHQIIRLKSMRLRLKVGVDAWEKEPDFYHDCVLTVELYRHDSVSLHHQPRQLTEVMNYHRIYQYVKSLESAPHVELLETIAHDIARFCLQDEKASACRVILAKSTIYPEAEAAEIELFIQR
ncbi:MAG: dihydroneopterin aldolase [Alphaproteobacteria bacterium]